jgi:hypothetical protein
MMLRPQGIRYLQERQQLTTGGMLKGACLRR